MLKVLGVVLAVLSFQAGAVEKGESTASAGNLWSDSSSSVRITPMVGVAAMAVKTKEADSDVDGGASVGGLAEFGGGPISLQTGLIYNQFGGKKSVSGTDLKLNLNYLSIPLFAKLNVSGTADKTFYFKAGMMPSFLVSKEMRLSRGAASKSISDFSVGSVDLPIAVGIGGAIPVSTSVSMVIEALYLRSLVDYTFVNTKARNEGLIFSAGASIAL